MRQKVCVSSPWVSTHRDLAPDAVKPSQTLVALNGLVTLVTLGGAVPLHPEMVHHLRRGDGGEGEMERKKRLQQLFVLRQRHGKEQAGGQSVLEETYWGKQQQRK